MEQERTPHDPILCVNNCGFFGNPSTGNLCSQCSKLLCSTESKKSKGSGVDGWGVKVSASSSSEVVSCSNQPRNRCGFCNKKTGLLGFKCRCGNVFCSAHRHSDEHNCGFDYRRTGQAEIAKANPVVKADKIGKI